MATLRTRSFFDAPVLRTLLVGFLLASPVATTGCVTAADDVGAVEAHSTEQRFEITRTEIAGPEDEADQYLLDVSLGRLSASEFNELHAQFATQGESHDPSRIYNLVDFLPPFAQKTVGRVLVAHETPADAVLVDAMAANGMTTDGLGYVDANCHSVTWQWVNHMQGRGGDDAVLTLMDGDRLLIETDGLEEVSHSDLAPSDIYFAVGNGGLESGVLHTGVYLGSGLVFEKGNPGQDYPYRIAYLKDVMAKYERVDPEIDFVFKRISSATILATPGEAMSLVADQAAYGLEHVDDGILATYQLQEDWDWDLEESVYTLGRLLPSSAASSELFFDYQP